MSIAAILEQLSGKRDHPVVRYFLEIEQFAKANRESRPYQKLLAQNRFEIECARKYGMFSRRHAIMEPLVKLVTLIELPGLVRFWISLWWSARVVRKVDMSRKRRAVSSSSKSE